MRHVSGGGPLPRITGLSILERVGFPCRMVPGTKLATGEMT